MQGRAGHSCELEANVGLVHQVAASHRHALHPHASMVFGPHILLAQHRRTEFNFSESTLLLITCGRAGFRVPARSTGCKRVQPASLNSSPCSFMMQAAWRATGLPAACGGKRSDGGPLGSRQTHGCVALPRLGRPSDKQPLACWALDPNNPFSKLVGVVRMPSRGLGCLHHCMRPSMCGDLCTKLLLPGFDPFHTTCRPPFLAQALRSLLGPLHLGPRHQPLPRAKQCPPSPFSPQPLHPRTLQHQAASRWWIRRQRTLP